MGKENNIISTTRCDWVDVLKGITIILVVLGHVLTRKEYTTLKVYIYSFHMPLFFFVSGYLYNKVKYASFHELIKSPHI